MAKPQVGDHWHFRLFICGQTLASDHALENLHAFIDEFKLDKGELEIIDLLADPQKVKTEHVILTPTLICEGPARSIRLIGDLSAKDQIIAILTSTTNPTQH